MTYASPAAIKYTDIPKEFRKEKECTVCKTLFKPNSGVHKFCSESCKGKWKYINGTVTSKTQYNNISGHWDQYFKRLISFHQRKQDGLTVETLMRVLQKQDYKCALSGVRLTCLLEVGTKFKTNASIDRIEAGGPYVENNIQLVCAVLNKFRVDTDLNEYIWWCKQIAKYHEGLD